MSWALPPQREFCSVCVSAHFDPALAGVNAGAVVRNLPPRHRLAVPNYSDHASRPIGDFPHKNACISSQLLLLFVVCLVKREHGSFGFYYYVNHDVNY